jgi:DNA-binding CsgD family transcriptional regulator
MPDGRVIGFLHADRFHQGREVDVCDVELLSVFADLYGQVLERTMLLERLEGLRTSVGTLTQALNGAVNDCGSADLDMCADGGRSPSAVTLPLRTAASSVRGVAPPAPDSVLTSRELDVLKLMAGGDTNARIATRLVIAEGTVKSHVKHILRKLNAANRAEAVCRWLQREGRPD